MPKTGTIEDKNDKDLADAEEIKKRWKEYTEELYKKDLNEPDYYDGVVSHLEPDILECEVKCVLRSTATNKVSGCNEITAVATAVKSLQSCPTLSDPMDCSLPGSSVHGIFQARVLEWGAITS